MFAVRRTVVQSGRRLYTNGANGPVHPFFSMIMAKPAEKALTHPNIPAMYKYNAKKAWLSDRSTYPLITVLCCAGCFIVGMSINAFTYYKDLRINPNHKHQTIQDWGTEPTHHIAYIVGKNPVGMHSEDYKKCHHEGLGVDHDEWLKRKAAEASK